MCVFCSLARLAGKKREISQDELRKKNSPVNISCLRMKAVFGLINEYIDVAIQDAQQVLVGKPELGHVLAALKRFRDDHVTVP